MSQRKKFKWTNKSILATAGNKDPVQFIEMKVRDVVLSAMDSGWIGPPFDPVQLAKILGINISANASIPDARTKADKEGFFTVEFNPNKPRRRIRFSIAHEIAHTFFNDCAEEMRNREKFSYEKDNWQLEMLCNIAAAEIVMPIGSYYDDFREQKTLWELLELRREFDVSIEAVLIRYVKQGDKSFVIFCASKVEEGRNKGKYRFDYVIPSKKWNVNLPTGLVLDDSSIIDECTAIGYIAQGKAYWPLLSEEVNIESVGLPPYPGSVPPRVAGLALCEKVFAEPANSIRYQEGDATKPGGKGEKIIAHILNDKTPNWGGGGFAVSLKNRYPNAQSEYKRWALGNREEFRLGGNCLVRVSDDLDIFNMVAQHGFGESTTPRIRYSALKDCLEKLASVAIEKKASIHMPRIGVGNAGGRWNVVEEMINETLIDQGLSVNIYDLRKNPQNMEIDFAMDV